MRSALITGGERDEQSAAEYELDEIDRHIIAALKADGRATNQKIARSLKISPATVGARIRRLENVNAMRVVAVTDFAALGYKVLLAVGIEVQGRAAEEVAKELAALEEVFAVHLVTGARDIEILVALHDLEELETSCCAMSPRSAASAHSPPASPPTSSSTILTGRRSHEDRACPHSTRSIAASSTC